MAKTIGQWLKEGLTPQEYKNAKKHKVSPWSRKVNYLSTAILYGFNWCFTPEKGFWVDKYNELRREMK